jgi:hypothetical protein
MEITISLKWTLAIIFTLAWLISTWQMLRKNDDPIAGIFAIFLPAFCYLLFWVLWFVVFYVIL